MPRRHLALLGLTLVLTASLAAAPLANSRETQARLSYDVHFLASGALEGRFSGSEGAKVAAEFVADRFRQLGLKPTTENDSYFQHFSFIARVHPGPGNALVFELPGGTRTATVEEDFRPLSFSSSGSASGEVVFAGYGIHASDLGYDDYAGLDVKGKGVLMLRFSPGGDAAAGGPPPPPAATTTAGGSTSGGGWCCCCVSRGPATPPPRNSSPTWR